MSDLILSTPAEYGPVLIAIGFIVGVVITLAMSLSSYTEYAKDEAREDGTKTSYGLSYLAKNIVVVIFTVVMTLVIPGMYYELTGGVPTEMGCYLIGIVTALIAAIGGEDLMDKIVEAVRDYHKAIVARAEAQTDASSTQEE